MLPDYILKICILNIFAINGREKKTQIKHFAFKGDKKSSTIVLTAFVLNLFVTCTFVFNNFRLNLSCQTEIMALTSMRP